MLKNHYKDLSAKPFFKGLVEYMSSGPVVPMVLLFFTFDYISHFITSITRVPVWGGGLAYKSATVFPAYHTRRLKDVKNSLQLNPIIMWQPMDTAKPVGAWENGR